MPFGCDQICDHFAVKTGVRGRLMARTSEQSSRREALLVVMFTRILERFGRGDWIRTSDPLRPRQVRYQAALRPDRPSILASAHGWATKSTHTRSGAVDPGASRGSVSASGVAVVTTRVPRGSDTLRSSQ